MNQLTAVPFRADGPFLIPHLLYTVMYRYFIPQDYAGGHEDSLYRPTRAAEHVLWKQVRPASGADSLQLPTVTPVPMASGAFPQKP